MFDCFLQGVLMEFDTVVLRSTSNKNLRIKIWKWRKLWGTHKYEKCSAQRKRTKRITGYLLEYFKVLQI